MCDLCAWFASVVKVPRGVVPRKYIRSYK